MAIDVLEQMEQESNRAKAAASGFTPTFLRLKDRQKALVRPLFNLDQSVVLKLHSRFNNASPKDSVNAVCATETGQKCLYCATVAAASKDDKEARKLTAGVSFFLPVYVYGIKQQGDSGVWTDVTYKDSEDKDVPVSGLRVLELKAFGTINDVLQFLRSYYAEDDAHNITLCDFLIERKGADQTTTYVVLPKPPKAMDAAVKASIPTPEDVKKLILAACPVVVDGSVVASASNGNGVAKPASDLFVPEF